MPGATLDDFAVTIGAERAKLEDQRARIALQLEALAEAEAALTRYLALGGAAGAPPVESGMVGGAQDADPGAMAAPQDAAQSSRGYSRAPQRRHRALAPPGSASTRTPFPGAVERAQGDAARQAVVDSAEASRAPPPAQEEPHPPRRLNPLPRAGGFAF